MAANNIGRWSAQASLDANGFVSGINRMTNSLRGFVQGPNGLGIIANLPAAIGLTSIEGVFSRLNATLEQELDLGFVNDQLGTSVEWLTALRTVASENSVETDQFAGAMERMNQVLGQARLGNDQAVETFARLGISLQAIQSQGFEETFMQASRALAEMPDRATRARTAMELFGRGGAGNMLRFVQDLDKALEDVRGRGGFTTQEDLDRFNDMDDAVDRLTTAWESAWRSFLSTIAPAVTGYLERWSEMLSRPTWMQLLRLSGPTAASVAVAEEVFDILPDSWRERIVTAWEEGAFAVRAMFQGEILTLEEVRARMLAQLPQVNGALPALPGGVGGGGQGMFGGIFVGWQQQIGNAARDLANAMQQVADAQREAAQIVEATRTPYERFIEQTDRIEFLRNRNMLTQDQADRARAAAMERVMQGIGDTPGIGSLEQGSAEVADIIANASNPQMDVMQAVLAADQAIAENTRRMAELTAQLLQLGQRQEDVAADLSNQMPLL